MLGRHGIRAFRNAQTVAHSQAMFNFRYSQQKSLLRPVFRFSKQAAATKSALGKVRFLEKKNPLISKEQWEGLDSLL